MYYTLTIMKRSLFAIALVFIGLSCTKENPSATPQDKNVPVTEFEALKQEVAQLKAKIEALTPSEPGEGVSVAEFNTLKEKATNEINALKEENEELKAQIGKLTSGFFEVDGLRFDRNGTLISLAKIESFVEEKAGETLTRTTTRTYDAQNRLIQVYSKYSGGNSVIYGSYEWQKIIYEYSGMTCKITTQTAKRNMPVGVPYEEEIKEYIYW